MAEKYRDGLFRDYFNDKVRLLSLCNALIGEDGKNPDEIIINTLDGVFFDELKNDISCLYRGRFLVIIEHQSTINENMPLRMLFYATELLRQHVEPFRELLYRPKVLRLPRPEFFVLYNGKKKEFEFREMKLSDAFGGNFGFELLVKCYNINAGMNKEIISSSEYLKNYCLFIERVEKNISSGMDSKHAAAEAINYFIEHNIMAEYLTQRKGEVASMIGFEYDPEKAREVLADYHREEGRKEGREEEKITMIKNLLMAKTPLKYIVAATGWSEEKILKVAEGR